MTIIVKITKITQNIILFGVYLSICLFCITFIMYCWYATISVLFESSEVSFICWIFYHPINNFNSNSKPTKHWYHARTEKRLTWTRTFLRKLKMMGFKFRRYKNTKCEILLGKFSLLNITTWLSRFNICFEICISLGFNIIYDLIKVSTYFLIHWLLWINYELSIKWTVVINNLSSL